MSAYRPSRFVAAGARRGLHVSFEFFPPKTAEMEQSLWECVSRLAPLKPNFVSVTYGAGGSTRERTHATVKRILAETALTPAAHLTCVAATRAMTQFFFENSLYFRYLDRVRAAGIAIPIVPGILPVQNFKQTRNFAARTGASVPAWLAQRFDGLDDDPATRKLIAAAVAAEQVLDLVDHGVTDFHFYTMNRADLAYAICHLLGLRPEHAEAKAAQSLPQKERV